MTDIHGHYTLAKKLAHLFDNQFNFFGIRLGLDSIFGLIPGLGDIIGLVFSTYLIWIGHQMGLPTHKKLEMLKNVLIDFFVGSIPVLGDIADIFYKANIKNLKILESHTGIEAVEGEVIA